VRADENIQTDHRGLAFTSIGRRLAPYPVRFWVVRDGYSPCASIAALSITRITSGALRPAHSNVVPGEVAEGNAG